MNLTIAGFVTVDYRDIDFCRIDHFFGFHSPIPISFDELLISNMAQRRVAVINYHFGTFITAPEYEREHKHEYTKFIL